MRKCIGGNGQDTTSAVLAYLAAGRSFLMPHLYLIGAPEDPRALRLTDWDTPLVWSPMGKFLPAIIKRSNVTTKIGLEVDDLTITYSPPSPTFTQTIQTASPYQLAQIGYYDGWPVRVWTCYMPTPGDANTYGCSILFGGNVGDVAIQREQIQFTVNSFLAVVNQQVPTNVIGLTSNVAAYTGATPPPGCSSIPQMNVILGSSPTTLIADETSPNAHQIFGTNVLRGGFVVFNRGGSTTLGGSWSAIQGNQLLTLSGHNYNEIVLYAALPWAPTAGVDTFYMSGAVPIDAADGATDIFPYIPSPQQAI